MSRLIDLDHSFGLSLAAVRDEFVTGLGDWQLHRLRYFYIMFSGEMGATVRQRRAGVTPVDAFLGRLPGNDRD